MKNTCYLCRVSVRNIALFVRLLCLGSLVLPIGLYGQETPALARCDTATISYQGHTATMSRPEAAVEPTEPFRKHPLVVSAFNHSLGLPFKNMFPVPVHPGLMVGTEFFYRKGHHSQLLQTVQLGGFYSRYFGSSLFLSSDFAYRYTTRLGLFGEAMLGIGYMHAFHPRPVYALNSEGAYEKVTDWGKPSVMGSVSVGIGYDSGKRFSPFVRYQWLVQTPYAEALPLVPQGLLHLGVRIQLRKNS